MRAMFDDQVTCSCYCGQSNCGTASVLQPVLVDRAGISGELSLHKLCINATPVNQYVVRPSLNDASLVHDGDLRGIDDSAQPMRDNGHRTSDMGEA